MAGPRDTSQTLFRFPNTAKKPKICLYSNKKVKNFCSRLSDVNYSIILTKMNKISTILIQCASQLDEEPNMKVNNLDNGR